MSGTHIGIPACMYVFPRYSRAEIAYILQHGHVISVPKFHVLSNGALLSAISLILCTGKMIKLFTETVLGAFKVHFQHKTRLTGKRECTIRKSTNS
jgi:hypothetical protein